MSSLYSRPPRTPVRAARFPQGPTCAPPRGQRDEQKDMLLLVPKLSRDEMVMLEKLHILYDRRKIGDNERQVESWIAQTLDRVNNEYMQLDFETLRMTENERAEILHKARAKIESYKKVEVKAAWVNQQRKQNQHRVKAEIVSLHFQLDLMRNGRIPVAEAGPAMEENFTKWSRTINFATDENDRPLFYPRESVVKALLAWSSKLNIVKRPLAIMESSLETINDGYRTQVCFNDRAKKMRVL